MLGFVGVGSAFNTKLGNNCAFIKRDKTLFLIDCGSNIFERLQNTDLLDEVEKIHVLITHTHPDHIGSLGDLIFWGYYGMGEIGKPNVKVYAPHSLKISVLLRMMGVKENTYELNEFTSVGFVNELGIHFVPIQNKHVDELDCFGYLISYENKTIYYSGDSNDIQDPILEMFHNGEIDYFYQDTCKADYEGNVHLSLRRLDELIDSDKKLREKVYCMHLDNGFDANEAFDLGFNFAIRYR